MRGGGTAPHPRMKLVASKMVKNSNVENQINKRGLNFLIEIHEINGVFL